MHLPGGCPLTQVTRAYFDQFAVTEALRVINHADDDRHELNENELTRLGGGRHVPRGGEPREQSVHRPRTLGGVVCQHVRGRSHRNTSDLAPIVVRHAYRYRHLVALLDIFDFLTGPRRAKVKNQPIVRVTYRVRLRVPFRTQRRQRQITTCFEDLQQISSVFHPWVYLLLAAVQIRRYPEAQG